MDNTSYETAAYLKSLAVRSTIYFNAVVDARKFIKSAGVDDPEVAVNCTVMSILWAAALRDEKVTETDIFTILNIDIETELTSTNLLQIPNNMKDWPLDDVLEFVIHHG